MGNDRNNTRNGQSVNRQRQQQQRQYQSSQQQQYTQRTRSGENAYYDRRPQQERAYRRDDDSVRRQYRESNYVSDADRRLQQERRAKANANVTTSKGKKKMTKKQMRAKKRRRKIIAFIFELLLLFVIVVVGYGVSKLQKINYDPIKKEDIMINDVKSDDIKEYTNIALFGVDSRTKDGLTKDVHSDAIIIASINNKTKDVKLISVYRDTCLLSTLPSSSGEDVYRKATETYYFGGPTAAINMLNTNLDLDITDYVTVNFEALIVTIDLLGGIDIEIDENEQFYINGYMTETCAITERPYEELTELGYVHLSGLQATAFCRIRYGGGEDYKRTERQREVLSLMFEKAKKMDIATLNGIISEVCDNDMISTSLRTDEILSMALDIMNYNLVDTTGFPFDKKTKTISEGDCVFAVSLESNVEKLHEYMFGTTDYDTTSIVDDISNVLINKTGFYPEETGQ